MRLRRAWLLALLAAGAACRGPATQRIGYAPPPPAAVRPLAASLVVVPFEDARPARTYPSQMEAGKSLMLPLLPSVSVDYERLDETRAAAMHLRGAQPRREDLFEFAMARVVAADLAASGLFASVQFVADAPPDADLVLDGRLVSTRFTSTATSYLLGMPGVLLWFTALPAGRNTAVVAIDLTLRQGGEIVWEYRLDAEASRLFTLYTSGGKDVSSGAGTLSIPRYGDNELGIDPDSLWAFHSEALRSGMAGARASLAAYLSQPGASSLGATRGALQPQIAM